jgi:hypothetical protein
MAEHAFGVVGKHLLNLGNGIATLGQHHVERSFASLQIVCFDQDGCGYCTGNRGSPWRSLCVLGSLSWSRPFRQLLSRGFRRRPIRARSLSP